MSMLRRLAAAASALAIMAVAIPAQAQEFGNFIVFGDSLSDPGNLPTGLAPPAPYDGGRFSNGPVWAEQFQADSGLVDPAGANVNAALGGARADSDTNANGPIPGVPAQIGMVPAPLYTSDTLVSVWAGANDLFQQLPSATSPADVQAIGIETAGDQVANVATIAANSPGTILVPNLPNFGPAPGFNTNPQVAAAADGAVFTYNAALSQGLAQVSAANPGVNIVQLDVNGAFNAILANPAAFGFDNVSQACVATVACVTGTTEEQNRFLFWDDVHPTEAGHALISQLAIATLTFDDAARDNAAYAETMLNLRRHATTDIFDRVDSWLTSSYARRNGPWAEIKGYTGSEDGGADRVGYDWGFYGLRAGFDLDTNDNLIGASFGIMSGSIDTGALDADLMSVQFDIYASRFFGPFFATLQAGMAGTLNSEHERDTGVGPAVAEASADGYQFDVAGEVGALMRMGRFSLVPAARLTYILAHTGVYNENGFVTPLEYGSHEVTALFGSVRLRGIATLSPTMSAFAEIGYEDHLSYSNGDFTALLLNNTAAPATISVGDQSATGLYAKVGVDGNVSDSVSMSLSYGYENRGGDGEGHAGKLRVKVQM